MCISGVSHPPFRISKLTGHRPWQYTTSHSKHHSTSFSEIKIIQVVQVFPAKVHLGSALSPVLMLLIASFHASDCLFSSPNLSTIGGDVSCSVLHAPDTSRSSAESSHCNFLCSVQPYPTMDYKRHRSPTFRIIPFPYSSRSRRKLTF